MVAPRGRPRVHPRCLSPPPSVPWGTPSRGKLLLSQPRGRCGATPLCTAPGGNRQPLEQGSSDAKTRGTQIEAAQPRAAICMRPCPMGLLAALPSAPLSNPMPSAPVSVLGGPPAPGLHHPERPSGAASVEWRAGLARTRLLLAALVNPAKSLTAAAAHRPAAWGNIELEPQAR